MVKQPGQPSSAKQQPATGAAGPKASGPGLGARPAPPPGIKIKSNYVPRAKVIRGKKAAQICPRCNQPVPTSEMSEHMRIELLDPRYQEQKARHLAHHKDSNLTSSFVGSNLSLLAKTRPDIFGGDELVETQEREREREKERQRRDKEKAAAVWDGHQTSIPGVTAKMHQQLGTGAWKDQLREMRREREEEEKRVGAIGPKVPQSSASSAGPAGAGLPPLPPPVQIFNLGPQPQPAMMHHHQHEFGYPPPGGAAPPPSIPPYGPPPGAVAYDPYAGGAYPQQGYDQTGGYPPHMYHQQ
ncbi:SF3a splicing factor complex subunit [Thoreauomyces humboldtii]|nr:SF3a splicing factor complex subunit [Thoreauomyces humboldtii]